jgi:hypothetical protein
MRRKAILAVTLSVFVFGFVYVWTFGFFPSKDLKRTQALRTLVAQNVRVGDSPDLVMLKVWTTQRLSNPNIC